MRRLSTGIAAGLLLAGLGAALAGAEPLEGLAEQVRSREIAFARTMADRDHAAFVTFVSEEALFLAATVLRGREAVAEGWRPLFDGPQAPFSWEPERVEVTDSGTLAISTGSVKNSEGERIGTFNSTWRLEADGEWRVVLDIGCPPCRCERGDFDQSQDLSRSRTDKADEQVLAAYGQLVDALQRGDIETARQFWADDYVLTTRSGRVLDRPARLKSLRTGELRYLEAELQDAETRTRPGVVVLTGRVRSRVIRDGEERSIGWRRFTMVWVKEEGRWRVLARHASPPADP